MEKKMGKKWSLKEYGKSVMRELLKEPGKKDEGKLTRLEDLKMDDLKREKVRLDLEERKTLGEARELEAQKRNLFEEGIKVSGTREAKIIARKLKETDGLAANLDRLLDSLSQQTRIITGLIQAKDLARIQKESGIGALLGNFDMEDLVVFVDECFIDGEFNTAKMKEMQDVFNRPGLDRMKDDDQDITEIMKQFEQAREARDNPDAIDEKYRALNNQMEEKRKAKESPQFGEEL